LGLDARRALTDTQIELVASWRPRAADPIQVAVARNEARRLAREVLASTASLKENKALLAELVEQLAPGLQSEPGVGPVTAALILAAYSHHGRVRSEAAFAALAGACPIPASSGNTTRHRLNGNGDRQLNRALDVIARTRLTFDSKTKAYAERRTSEGMNRREVQRCLQRYVARQLYRKLQTIMA
jgi:transposase